jgi:hypothetical protein
MNLPKVVSDFVNGQNNFDSEASANCFSVNGIMLEEGKPYTGRVEIQGLLEETNEKYQSVMKPLEFIEDGTSSVLSAEVSGTFPGSPAVLKFHFTLNNNLIDYLKVTG